MSIVTAEDKAELVEYGFKRASVAQWSLGRIRAELRHIRAEKAAEADRLAVATNPAVRDPTESVNVETTQPDPDAAARAEAIAAFAAEAKSHIGAVLVAPEATEPVPAAEAPLSDLTPRARPLTDTEPEPNEPLAAPEPEPQGKHETINDSVATGSQDTAPIADPCADEHIGEKPEPPPSPSDDDFDVFTDQSPPGEEENIIDFKKAKAKKAKSPPPLDENENNERLGEGASDLAKMNALYAVVKVGGKTRVMSLVESETYPGCKVPEFSTIADFRQFHQKYKRFVYDENGKIAKTTTLGQWWIEHADRRQYNGIIYAPGGTSKGMFNLWTGFSCEPTEGDCDLYLKHLQDNICSGDDAHYEYLINWMAHAVQHPDRQGEVAVIMRGKEGTGKGVAAKGFGYLFGPHFRHLVHGKHLTGHFNAHLQQASVVYGDEAFFAGDRAHESTLKALITEETLHIEPKGVDAFEVRNRIHLIMSSNSDWVIPAGAEARRYFVLNVSDACMQNHRYFAAIAQAMETGGREALLFHLLNRDLSSFNVGLVPQTGALAQQKAHTRRGIDRLVEQIAHQGMLPSVHAIYPNIAVTTGEEERKGFYHQARELVPDLKHDGSIVIINKLKEEWGCEPWKSGNQRGIKFPPLAELRAFFDKKHGPQSWPPAEAGKPVEWDGV